MASPADAVALSALRPRLSPSVPLSRTVVETGAIVPFCDGVSLQFQDDVRGTVVTPRYVKTVARAPIDCPELESTRSTSVCNAGRGLPAATLIRAPDGRQHAPCGSRSCIEGRFTHSDGTYRSTGIAKHAYFKNTENALTAETTNPGAPSRHPLMKT